MDADRSTFNGNMRVLSERDPALAERIVAAVPGADLVMSRAKTGVPVARVGNVTLHSTYDPGREAREWVEGNRPVIDGADSLWVLGFGLGYHVSELCRSTDAQVTVFEPRLDVLRMAFESADLTGVLSKVRFVAGDGIPPGREAFRTLTHCPSVSASPGYFERLGPKLKNVRSIRKGLRVAVVGPIYGGSLPIAEFCVSALRNLGHEAEYVDSSGFASAYGAIEGITRSDAHRDILRARFVEFASEAAMARIVAMKPDLVFALAQAPLSEAAYRTLRESKVPVAFWFVEDFRHMPYWSRIAPLCDWFFTIQQGAFHDALRQAGVRNFAFLPLAASTGSHLPMELSDDELAAYGGDVSFVGAGYYNRRKFFEGLIDLDFRIWGDGWDLSSPLARCIQRGGERIGTDEIVRIFSASKINMNLHSSTYHEGVNPHGDFVNPRVFEISACEGFQLVDSRSGLSGFFDVGRELICFSDLQDARRKIAHYLERPDERRTIAMRARARVLRDHTYEHRMEAMLGFLAERGYAPPPWGRGENSDPGDLVEEAGRDTGLGRYLARYTGRPRLTPSDIVDDIRSGDGGLSEIERMMLALHEMAG